MVEGDDTGLTVLVVEADDDERARFGAWLEDDGFGVLTCPGPSEPDYTCVGSRTGGCALARAADVVVLDMSTRSEDALLGVPSEELLGVYLAMDARVLALGSRGGEEVAGRLARLRRHPDASELLAAVRSLARGPESPTAAGPSTPA